MTWCLDLVFRDIYIFSLHFFTRPITIESSSIFLKQSLVKIGCCPAALLKRDYGAVVFLNENQLLKLFHSSFFLSNNFNPANIYLPKINYRNTRKKSIISVKR